MWKALGLAGMVLAAGEAWGCEDLSAATVLLPALEAKGVALNTRVIMEQEDPQDSVPQQVTVAPAVGSAPGREVGTTFTVLRQAAFPSRRLLVFTLEKDLEPNTSYWVMLSGTRLGTFETGSAEESGTPAAPQETARTAMPAAREPPINYCAAWSPCSWQNVVDVQSDARFVVAVTDGVVASNIGGLGDNLLGWSNSGRVRFEVGDACLDGTTRFRFAAVGADGSLTFSRGAAQVGSVTRAGCSQAEWGEAGGVLWVVVGMWWGRRRRRSVRLHQERAAPVHPGRA